MAIHNGDNLLYVDSRGGITKVVAATDERNGSIEIETESGRSLGSIGMLHLFRTERAANIAAEQRKPKNEQKA